jgi:sec-independent protein translocase protein TatB
MFDVGFSEVLLIFVIALVVLGPEKLPRLASQVGRWIGRARSMARQFREQLEEEVNLEEVRKAHAKPQKTSSTETPSDSQGQPSQDSSTSSGSSTSNPTASADSSGADPQAAQPGTTPYHGPDPADFRADTFSHAHPTNEYGANPYTSTGAPEEPPPGTPGASEPSSAHVSPAQSQCTFDPQTASEANVAAAQPEPASQAEQRAPSPEAYAAQRPRDNTPGTDNHGN